MEYRLRPWLSCSFLQNNDHQAVKKKYISNIYYLSLLYNSSILDIEYSPYHIALGSTHSHKVS